MPISAIEIGWRVYLPAFFATSVGLPLAAIGTLMLAVRLFDNAIDPFVARASTTIERLDTLGPNDRAQVARRRRGANRIGYRMALNGVGNRGPMSLKSIATWLNENNTRTRDGGRWGLGAAHQVLTRTTYIGQHRFNTRDHKAKTPKPESEHAVTEVPAIVSEAEFEAVQRSLKARSPKMMSQMPLARNYGTATGRSPAIRCGQSPSASR